MQVRYGCLPSSEPLVIFFRTITIAISSHEGWHPRIGAKVCNDEVEIKESRGERKKASWRYSGHGESGGPSV